MTRRHAGPDGGALGQLLGLPVIEAAGALFNRPVLATYPGGGQALYVRDAWTGILLPFMIGDMRQALRLHLDHVVRSAEQRLGLPGTQHQGSGGLEEYLARQNTAYAGPVGTWAERWLPFICKHEAIRCTHGDEIIARRWRRRVCMVCGRALRGDLPAMCWFTGRLHASAAR